MMIYTSLLSPLLYKGRCRTGGGGVGTAGASPDFDELSLVMLPKENHAGFTLVEILVAVTIVALIFSFILGVLTTNMEASREATAKMEIIHEGRFFINRITYDIMSATLLPNSATGGFVGRDLHRDGKSKDELYFTSFARTYISPGPDIDQVEVGYHFSRLGDGRELLMRRESNVIDEDLASGGQSFRISSRVDELRLRYRGNQGWQDSWDTTSGNKKLPQAVAIELTLTDGKKEYFFSGMVRPQMANG